MDADEYWPLSRPILVRFSKKIFFLKLMKKAFLKISQDRGLGASGTTANYPQGFQNFFLFWVDGMILENVHSFLFQFFPLAVRDSPDSTQQYCILILLSQI